MVRSHGGLETLASITIGLIQLPVDQRDRGQDVEGVLLGHVPIDLRVVGEGVADGPVKALQEADEAPLLATLGLGQEGVDRQERGTELLAERLVDELGSTP